MRGLRAKEHRIWIWLVVVSLSVLGAPAGYAEEAAEAVADSGEGVYEAGDWVPLEESGAQEEGQGEVALRQAAEPTVSLMARAESEAPSEESAESEAQAEESATQGQANAGAATGGGRHFLEKSGRLLSPDSQEPEPGQSAADGQSKRSSNSVAQPAPVAEEPVIDVIGASGTASNSTNHKTTAAGSSWWSALSAPSWASEESETLQVESSSKAAAQPEFPQQIDGTAAQNSAAITDFIDTAWVLPKTGTLTQAIAMVQEGLSQAPDATPDFMDMDAGEELAIPVAIGEFINAENQIVFVGAPAAYGVEFTNQSNETLVVVLWLRGDTPNAPVRRVLQELGPGETVKIPLETRFGERETGVHQMTLSVQILTEEGALEVARSQKFELVIEKVERPENDPQVIRVWGFENPNESAWTAGPDIEELNVCSGNLHGRTAGAKAAVLSPILNTPLAEVKGVR
ncbi:MAG: hypothetical protein JW937_10315, partial [Candidatus Omnitrophica bacterium]|nr:hypothetical protein [Candidatus Omnitrophota bacterium]